MGSSQVRDIDTAAVEQHGSACIHSDHITARDDGSGEDRIADVASGRSIACQYAVSIGDCEPGFEKGGQIGDGLIKPQVEQFSEASAQTQ